MVIVLPMIYPLLSITCRVSTRAMNIHGLANNPEIRL